jgi:DNA-binding beta-propeller fold protein YncE
VGATVEIGSDFLGYRIEELIGQGGMGVVYRSYDLRLKRPVALKLIAPALAADDGFRTRFAREAELAMSLEHPNVVPIYDAGDVDGSLYLAMRLVDGQDLGSLLTADGPLEPARAVVICSQVAAALDAAHARGLVHRDVKPSNVLLDGDEHVYLADFGLTRRLEEQTADQGQGRSLGTPAYLAPEQIEGGPVDGRADVYSLACLLFESLTGEVVFPRGSRLAVTWAHLEEEPPSASGRNAALPAAVDAVIARAMAKAPADRYATCSAMVEAAERALGLRAERRAGRRRRLALAGAALAAIGVAAALVLALTAGGDNAPPPAHRLFGEADTLVRVDPRTNRVTRVVPVAPQPMLSATAGRSVWVYSDDGADTLSRIDTATNAVRQTAATHVHPIDFGAFSGPALVADTTGAWLIGLDRAGTPRLLRADASGMRMRRYRLDHDPQGVALGFGAVWVTARGKRDNEVLRIDPASGRVTARTRFPASAPIDGIATGYGAVWAVGSADGALYRIGPWSGRVTGRLRVGGPATRPAMLTHLVWVADAGGTVEWIEPRGLTIQGSDDCCLPDWGDTVSRGNWLWWYDWPTASVYRQHSIDEAPRQIRVLRSPPQSAGPCLTSIAVGAAIWVTAAPSFDLHCPR